MADPLRVLVCDDSLGFPTLVRAWLREDGRFVVVGLAAGGEQAKAMITEQRPDVLLLDLVLPDAPDPTVLVAALRALHPPVRILMISSLHDDALESAAVAAGADGYCNKAATAVELTDRIYAVSMTARDSSTQRRLP